LRQVRKSHLAADVSFGDPDAVAELADREMLDAILASCQYLHVKVNRILGYIEDDGEEEEENGEPER
jgi:hypothetical protein